MQVHGGIVSDQCLAPIPHEESLPEAGGALAIFGSLSKYAAYGGIVADGGLAPLPHERPQPEAGGPHDAGKPLKHAYGRIVSDEAVLWYCK